MNFEHANGRCVDIELEDGHGNRIQIQFKNNASYASIYKQRSGKYPDWNLGGLI